MRKSACANFKTMLILTFGLLLQTQLYAWQPRYNERNIDSYFNSAEHFAIVVRIEGGVTESSYLELQQQFQVGEAPRLDSNDEWYYDRIRDEGPTKFLVVKNLIGSLNPTIEVQWDARETANFPLGEPVAAFIRPSRYTENVYTTDQFEILDANLDIVTKFDGDLTPVIDYFRPFALKLQ